MSKSQLRHIHDPVSSIDRDRNYNISITMAVIVTLRIFSQSRLNLQKSTLKKFSWTLSHLFTTNYVPNNDLKSLIFLAGPEIKSWLADSEFHWWLLVLKIGSHPYLFPGHDLRINPQMNGLHVRCSCKTSLNKTGSAMATLNCSYI